MLLRLDGIIPDVLAGSRADRALAELFPQHSRTRIQGWIRAGAATLDGAAVRVRDRVAGGERVSIVGAVEDDDRSVAQPGPLAVLYHDPDLLVLDKPPGLVVHPGAGNRDGTLLNRLLAYDPGLRSVPRAGLVHRLDKDTSGVMLVARSLHAHTRLVARIKAREVERVYEAVVAGSPPSRATVEAPIGRDRIRRTRMAVEPRGRHAVTHYRVVETQAVVRHVSAFDIRWMGAAELAPDRYEIDQRPARAQLVEPELGELALQGAAEHVDVERHGLVEACASQHDVVESGDADRRACVHSPPLRPDPVSAPPATFIRPAGATPAAASIVAPGVPPGIVSTA